MSFGVRLHVWGELALFTRPEMKAERVSYDVITPSAARNLIQAIYWKPQIQWVIDRIHVLKPIAWINIRRNEVGSKIPASSARQAMKAGKGDLGMFIEENRQQRASLALRDVSYVIEAHFDVLDPADSADKHFAVATRRMRQGQCFHHPYLGCREFPAHFALVEGDMPASELPPEQATRDLGFMLHDIDYGNDMQPRFFRAQMVNGVIEVPPFASQEVHA